jgi:hypothetical protein
MKTFNQALFLSTALFAFAGVSLVSSASWAIDDYGFAIRAADDTANVSKGKPEAKPAPVQAPVAMDAHIKSEKQADLDKLQAKIVDQASQLNRMNQDYAKLDDLAQARMDRLGMRLVNSLNGDIDRYRTLSEVAGNSPEVTQKQLKDMVGDVISIEPEKSEAQGFKAAAAK